MHKEIIELMEKPDAPILRCAGAWQFFRRDKASDGTKEVMQMKIDTGRIKLSEVLPSGLEIYAVGQLSVNRNSDDG